MIRIAPLAVVATMFAGLLGPAPAAMADQQLPVPEIEKIVRDYLMREPQVIYEAIQELQKRQQEAEAARAQAAIVERADEIFRDTGDPVIGPEAGDVTLVEFFDYHCGYCRAMVPKLQNLIDGDSQLRFVFKELPVLGPDSVTAAKASLAASKLDPAKYYGFHLAVMQSKDIGLDSVLKIAGEQGYEVGALRAEMDAAWIQERLDANQALAQSLGINGTPSFVIGKTLIPGAVDVARLEELIAGERKAVN
ncbi:MAG: DsbA family protein [Geminicoccaceae bacterium]